MRQAACPPTHSPHPQSVFYDSQLLNLTELEDAETFVHTGDNYSFS